jgi:DNA-binding transcriptional ArsR family regulator
MTVTDEALDLTFAALADGTRRAILARLAVGEATVNELAEPFSISLQAVSKHLKVLEKAGLITRSRDAQWRPCRLELPPLEGAGGQTVRAEVLVLVGADQPRLLDDVVVDALE